MKRVYLEITNSCNLNCSFCTNNKGHDFMNLNDIKNNIDQISEVCNYIYLHVLGEPLLHPNFEEILDYLDEKKMNLQLVTNGTLLYKYPDILEHKSLRKLSISLHSINNIDVDQKYFDIVNKLIDNTKECVIELRFYDKQNLDDKLTNYLNYLKSTYCLNNTKKKDSYKLKENVYIYFQQLFDWPNINDPFISDSGYCHGLIDQIAILCNGDITTCCLDPNGNNKIGNIYKNNLVEILNSNEYMHHVSKLKEKVLTFELCKHCKFRTRFDHNNN